MRCMQRTTLYTLCVYFHCVNNELSMPSSRRRFDWKYRQTPRAIDFFNTCVISPMIRCMKAAVDNLFERQTWFRFRSGSKWNSRISSSFVQGTIICVSLLLSQKMLQATIALDEMCHCLTYIYQNDENSAKSSYGLKVSHRSFNALNAYSLYSTYK